MKLASPKLDTTHLSRDEEALSRCEIALEQRDNENPQGALTYYGSDGRVYERTAYGDYEFNAKGDWVQRRETKEETFNRHSVSMTFREIEYYLDTKCLVQRNRKALGAHAPVSSLY